MAAGRWMGRGDKNGSDGAAVTAMRSVLQTVAMDGTVIIGEGEKDEAPMLFNGERVGSGSEPIVDVAVDPIDGTTLLSLGRPNSLAVITVSGAGTMFDPGPCVYMEKIATGPIAAGAIDLDRPVAENLKAVAAAKDCSIENVTVVILDRDRHAEIIADCRGAGARIRLIPDGDVAGALSTAIAGSGADILYGIGGTPEGVIAAGALKALGGEMQGRLWPRNDAERHAAEEAGYDLSQILTTDDLVAGDDIFFAATGITDGEFLRGVRYEGDTISTHSMVMRSRSGTVRHVEASHRLSKLNSIAPEIFGAD